MSQAGPKASAGRRSIWAGPLLAGACFGLAYGICDRLLAVNVGELIRFGQGFDVQEFPGTSLESLRLRFGATDAELRGNLELQQLQRQKPDETTAPAIAPAAPPVADAEAAAADSDPDTAAPGQETPPPTEPATVGESAPAPVRP